MEFRAENFENFGFFCKKVHFLDFFCTKIQKKSKSLGLICLIKLVVSD